MKKLIAVLMIASFAGAALPAAAQSSTTPAPAATTPAAPATPAKSEHGKSHAKKHKKSKTEPKS